MGLIREIFLAVVHQNVGQNFGVFSFALLGQCQKWQYDNNTAQPVCFAMPQSKVQHSQRLADAGWGGQREKPARGLTCSATLFKYPISDGVQCRVSGGSGPQGSAMLIQRPRSGIGIQRGTTCLL